MQSAPDMQTCQFDAMRGSKVGSPIGLKFPDAIQTPPALALQLGPRVLWERVFRVHISAPGCWQGEVEAQAPFGWIERVAWCSIQCLAFELALHGMVIITSVHIPLAANICRETTALP